MGIILSQPIKELEDLMDVGKVDQIISREDVEPLRDDIIVNYNIELSDNIYYAQYPYGVKFHRAVPERLLYRINKKNVLAVAEPTSSLVNATRAYLCAEIESYCAINDINTRRSAGANYFFRTHDELERILVEFEDDVHTVMGPVCDEHIDILFDPNFITKSGKPYYNRYEYSLKIFSRKFLFRYRANADERHEKARALIDKVKAQMPEDYKTRTESSTYSFFFNDDHVMSIYSMLKLSLTPEEAENAAFVLERRVS